MPGILQLVQVERTPKRIQSFLIKNEEVMLVNPDITNNIFIGNDPGSQLISVPALGSVTLDTKTHDLWVSTNGGNYSVSAYLMPNGSNWVPSPAQVAAQIQALGLATASNQATQIANDGTVISNTGSTASNTNTTASNTGQTATNVANLTTGGSPGGIPILRGTDNFGTATNATLAPATSVNLLTSVNVSKPSFEAIFQFSFPSGVGTLPFVRMSLNWQDSLTGLQVGSKTYIMCVGNAPANAITCYLSGPCRGNQISINMQNRDPAQTLTYTWAFNQTSHVYTIDRLLQPAYPAVAPVGYTSPAGNPGKGLLFFSSPSIGPSATVPRLCAASNAKVKVNIDNAAQANPCAVVFNTLNGSAYYDEGTAGSPLFGFSVAIGARDNREWQMPNGPVVVNMINQAATNTINPSISITSMEY